MGGSMKCCSIGSGAPVSEARSRGVAGTTRSELLKRRQIQSLIVDPVVIIWCGGREKKLSNGSKNPGRGRGCVDVQDGARAASSLA